jgi:hypothetical protein
MKRAEDCDGKIWFGAIDGLSLIRTVCHNLNGSATQILWQLKSVAMNRFSEVDRRDEAVSNLSGFRMNTALTNSVAEVLSHAGEGALSWESLQVALAKLVEDLDHLPDEASEPPDGPDDLKSHESYKWIVANLGDDATIQRLLAVGFAAAREATIAAPGRKERRKRSNMLTWFATNWDDLKAIVPFIQWTEVPLSPQIESGDMQSASV